jgi:hypothetical protein
MPQSQVYMNQSAGVPGELFNDSPTRAQAFILESEDADNNVFGRAFTVVAGENGIAQAGGTGVFAGFLINPKAHASYGTSAGGPLAPTLTLANEVVADILNMGTLFVTLPAAASVGDLVIFDQDTGELETISPGDDLPDGFGFAHAVVDYYNVTAAGIAVITVTDVPPIPEPAP